MNKQRAFTLLEMLVAIGIFAIVGLISAQLLSHSVRLTEHVLTRSDFLHEIQRTIHILRWDVEQLVHRPIRDQLGDRQPALTLSTGGELEFTRGGWQNPLNERRSNMLRVAYLFDGSNLIRRWWPVLDRSPKTIPQDQLLLTNVNGIEFICVDSAGQTHRFWPPTALPESETRDELVAIVMTLSTDAIGSHNWLWLTPERVEPIRETSVTDTPRD